MSARERVLKAHRTLLNGSGELSYFERRGITEETVRGAYVGFESGTFTYPCIARAGGLLGIHLKSKNRDGKGKRRQRWEGYANDLPPKGHGKKPDEPAKMIPFGLETLKGLKPGSLVVLCYGEEDALSTRQAGYTAVSQPGAGLLEPVYAEEFAGFEVVVFYDAGEEQEARKDALKLEQVGAKDVRVVEWPKEAPHGTDINERLVEDPEGFGEWVAEMIANAARPSPVGTESVGREGEPDRYAGEDPGSEERRPNQAESLLGCAEGADVFHTPSGDAYATVPVGGHRETHPIKSRGFKRWLVRRFYGRYGKPPGGQALQDALGVLEAKAQFDGPERSVYVRVAEHEGSIYVDLADQEWRAVEITDEGWRVVTYPPVRFRRTRGMLPLPVPEKDGTAKQLRRFINVGDEDEANWRLLLAWLVQALRPTGPYPVLILQGEQGSAKSTVERMLRALIYPSTAPLRTMPKGERDLIIAANNAWVVAFDNISILPPWLSDALCRLSTGGGFSARELYTDPEEVLFDATRPQILNGITDVATRPDLLDRGLIVTLPPIPEQERKPEAELWGEFEEERPAILGALFDAVSAALRNLPSTELDRTPRMADFALWASAAEGAFGCEPGAFMKAYGGNREEANETALEADPVVEAVRKLMNNRDEWSGTATELWKELGSLVDEEVKRSKAWPKAPNALSNRMKRLAPALRNAGIEYGEAEEGHEKRRVKALRKGPRKTDRIARTDRTDGKDPQKGAIARGRSAADAGDDGAVAGDPGLEDSPQEPSANGRLEDGAGDAGADLRWCSSTSVATAREEEDDPGMDF